MTPEIMVCYIMDSSLVLLQSLISCAGSFGCMRFIRVFAHFTAPSKLTFKMSSQATSFISHRTKDKLQSSLANMRQKFKCIHFPFF